MGKTIYNVGGLACILGLTKTLHRKVVKKNPRSLDFWNSWNRNPGHIYSNSYILLNFHTNKSASAIKLFWNNRNLFKIDPASGSHLRQTTCTCIAPRMTNQNFEDVESIDPKNSIFKSRKIRCRATVGFREIETTVFDPASVFLSTHWWSQQPSLPVLFL